MNSRIDKNDQGEEVLVTTKPSGAVIRELIRPGGKADEPPEQQPDNDARALALALLEKPVWKPADQEAAIRLILAKLYGNSN